MLTFVLGMIAGATALMVICFFIVGWLWYREEMRDGGP